MSGEHHEEFKKTLAASVEPVWVVAQWLSKEYPVDIKINQQNIAPDYHDRMAHVDDGDLYIYSSSGEHRVEVKRLSVDFTCRGDWPYGRHFIVCARHSFDNADPMPRFYVITNHRITHAGIVSASSSDKWTCAVRSDSRRNGRAQEFYLCPIYLVEFVPIRMCNS